MTDPRIHDHRHHLPLFRVIQAAIYYRGLMEPGPDRQQLEDDIKLIHELMEALDRSN
jgi:hypothetical protein